MPEITYSQRAYGGTRLGTCDGIDRGLYGCWVSTMAASLTHWAGPGTNAHPDWQVDPGQLDDILTARGLYVNGCDGTDTAITRLHPEIELVSRLDYGSVAADLTQLAMGYEDELTLQLDGYFVGLGYQTHYVRAWSWDGSTLKVGNPWSGQVESYSASWAARAITAIIRYRLPGFVPSWAQAPAPPPVTPPAGTFQGAVMAGGVHVRNLPGQDMAIVQQPGSNPDLVDAGTILTFDAWCVHTPRGGQDPPLYDDSFSPPRLDNRWFRTTLGNWVASVGISYQGGADPPANLLVPDPGPAAPPAPPVPDPAHPNLELPAAMKNMVAWETAHTYAPAPEYGALAQAGFKAVLIRAANGDGTGNDDASFTGSWTNRQAAARLAGLLPIAWTYWYGPSEGVRTDVATYLMGCAEYTARLNLDTPAWVINAEDRELPGLAAALLKLSVETGKPVLLCFPGDPASYGLKWAWNELSGACAGYLPEVYTEAWGSSPTFEMAMAELAELHGTQPLLPVLNETDEAGIRQVVGKVRAAGHPGASWWCVSNAPPAAGIYADAWSGSSSPSAPPGFPAPSSEVVSWLRDLLRWLEA